MLWADPLECLFGLKLLEIYFLDFAISVLYQTLLITVVSKLSSVVVLYVFLKISDVMYIFPCYQHVEINCI
jgi:hypothetical protein